MNKVQITIKRENSSVETLEGRIVSLTTKGAFVSFHKERDDIKEWFPWESKNIRMVRLS